jgi:hypothetical protein
LPLELIKKVAEANMIPPAFLAAIVIGESGGDQFAIRFEPHYKWLFKVKENAAENKITEDTERVMQMTSWGLCQVMGAVARELGIKGSIFAMLEPSVNLKIASHLIVRLRNKYKSPEDIFAAYNAGSVIKKSNGEYSNQLYVNKAMSFMKMAEPFFKEMKNGSSG